MKILKKNEIFQKTYMAVNRPFCAVAYLLFLYFGCIASSGAFAIERKAEELASKKVSEYKIKAVYLYKFLMFVDWPETDNPDTKDDEIVLGILGKDPFGKNFDIVDGKVIKSRGKILRIKRFGDYNEKLDLAQCDLLFICSSEMKNISRIVKGLKSKPVLTVADTKGFLEAGGMINLLISNPKVQWEVNMTPLWWSNLRPHSQFLRIAVRVVEIPKINKEKGQPFK